MLSPPCKYSLAYVLFDVKNDDPALVRNKLSVQAERRKKASCLFWSKRQVEGGSAFCDKKSVLQNKHGSMIFCYLFSSTGTGRFKVVVPSARLLTSSATSMPVASLMNAKDWAKPSLVWPETPAAPSKTVS